MPVPATNKLLTLSSTSSLVNPKDPVTLIVKFSLTEVMPIPLPAVMFLTGNNPLTLLLKFVISELL